MLYVYISRIALRGTKVNREVAALSARPCAAAAARRYALRVHRVGSSARCRVNRFGASRGEQQRRIWRATQSAVASHRIVSFASVSLDR